ncbi:MAG: S-layer homology domain-containing protein [Oscillospiraceae bacterium]|nr:S-layer homology domain-containing protein [Oscillospiraceae bacterium]
MKTSKRALCLLLILCMLLSLTVLASAKTSSEEIPAPAGDATVFSISAGDVVVGFTWDEICGKGDYEAFTNTYAARVDGEQTTQEWTGVRLADLLAAAGTKLGLTLEDDYKLSASAADGFKSVFTVGDVKDADNAYMAAPDPVKNFDGDTIYPDSYVRILLAAETSNKANIRCVTGIEILYASGNPIGAAPAFNDLAGYEWAEEAIAALCEKGVVKGIGGGAFGPGLILTRAQLVTMLWRAAGEPHVETDRTSEVPAFTDVEAGEWYSDAVAWAEANGIVKGYGNGKFGTDDDISIEQLAAILYRYAGSPEVPEMPLPEGVSDWAEDAVAWALANSLLPSVSGGKTLPPAGATRAEAAFALYGALNAD